MLRTQIERAPSRCKDYHLSTFIWDALPLRQRSYWLIQQGITILWYIAQTWGQGSILSSSVTSYANASESRGINLLTSNTCARNKKLDAVSQTSAMYPDRTGAFSWWKLSICTITWDALPLRQRSYFQMRCHTSVIQYCSIACGCISDCECSTRNLLTSNTDQIWKIFFWDLRQSLFNSTICICQWYCTAQSCPTWQVLVKAAALA
jgi:hypothetical protein